MAARGEAQAALEKAISGMIISSSGWRGVFAASGGEEDGAAEIGEGHRLAAIGAAAAFAGFLRGRADGGGAGEAGGSAAKGASGAAADVASGADDGATKGAARPIALVGSDTRPTSRAIAEAVVPALLASGCEARYAGFAAAPEIMAWARSLAPGAGGTGPSGQGSGEQGSGGGPAAEPLGFLYISASHNPIGHNGLKFGLADGGVLPAREAAELAEAFRAMALAPGSAARLERLAAGADPAALREAFAAEPSAKKQALAAYLAFAEEVAWLGAETAVGSSIACNSAADETAVGRNNAGNNCAVGEAAAGRNIAGSSAANKTAVGRNNAGNNYAASETAVGRNIAGSSAAAETALGRNNAGNNCAASEAAAGKNIAGSSAASEAAAGARRALELGIARRPLGVCCDFNGSARSASIDREFFEGLGIRFEAMNARPGGIAHRIVPEGESLEPCRAFLEELRGRDPAFAMGYVPDCDGDRGNLVIWDEALGKARALEAQEVFAVACVAELAHLAWSLEGRAAAEAPDSAPRIERPLAGARAAIAANDPTSFRIDRIAQAFGASVFRAEVGEANVVGLARRLRAEGYAVRALGEGSAGGNITHPSAVRDPLHTVLALAKLLSLRGSGGGAQPRRRGLFEIWCGASGQALCHRPDFGISDVIASLPPFATTGAYSPEALMQVSCADHGALKSRYQRVFLREWERRKGELRERYGIYGWQAIAYNEMEERAGIGDFGQAGRGGLKICFLGAGGKAVASVWMRGSATEPVFRVMADAEAAPEWPATERSAPERPATERPAREGAAAGGEAHGEAAQGPACAERDLIEWQRRMIAEADGALG